MAEQLSHYQAPTVGMDDFEPLRTGHIHLWCPSCGRKMSNGPRGVHDPAGAAVIAVPCDRCGSGGWAVDCDYYDASGRYINPESEVQDG